MGDCWKELPEDRPDFESIEKSCLDIKKSIVSNDESREPNCLQESSSTTYPNGIVPKITLGKVNKRPSIANGGHETLSTSEGGYQSFSTANQNNDVDESSF